MLCDDMTTNPRILSDSEQRAWKIIQLTGELDAITSSLIVEMQTLCTSCVWLFPFSFDAACTNSVRSKRIKKNV